MFIVNRQPRRLTDEEMFGAVPDPQAERPPARRLTDAEMFGVIPSVPTGPSIGQRVARAFSETGKAVVGGLYDAGSAVGDLALRGADVAVRPLAKALDDEASYEAARQSLADLFAGQQKPEWLQPQDPTARVLQPLVQGGAGVAAGMGMAAGAGPLAQALGAAAGDFAAFRGADPNLSTLLSELINLPLPTATNPDDPELLNRLRNVAEGFGVGAVAARIIESLPALARWRAKRAQPDAPITPEEIAESVRAGDPDIIEVLRAAGQPVESMSPDFAERAAARILQRQAEDAYRSAYSPVPPDLSRFSRLSPQTVGRPSDPSIGKPEDRGGRHAAALRAKLDKEILAERQLAEAIQSGEVDPSRLTRVDRRPPDVIALPEDAAAVTAQRRPFGALGSDDPGIAAGARAAVRAAEQTDEEAAKAFRLAEAQRQRAVNAETSVRDTQPAGRPMGGVEAQTLVYLDEGHPVQILDEWRRVGPNGVETRFARVQRYDPRTGQPEPDAIEYEIALNKLKKAWYGVPDPAAYKRGHTPRLSQDFEVRATAPRIMSGAAKGRRADDVLGLERQTYRMTPDDPQDFGTRAATGEPPVGPRAPFPKQDPNIGPERPWSTAEDIARDFAERQRAQEEARARQQAYEDEFTRAEQAARAGKAQPPPSSNRPAGLDETGAWQIDEHGYVKSDQGGPIKFGDVRQAAQWILREGQAKSQAGQHFDIANHPFINGAYTARERDASRAARASRGGSSEGGGAGRQGNSGDTGAGRERQGADADAAFQDQAGPQFGARQEGARARSGARQGGPKPADGAEGKTGDKPRQDREARADNAESERARAGEAREQTGEQPRSEGRSGGGSVELFSNPVGPMARWLFGEAADNAAHFKQFLKVARGLKGTIWAREDGQTALGDFLRTTFYTLDGHMRSVAGRFNSPTLNAIIDSVSAVSGKGDAAPEGIEAAISRRISVRYKKIDSIVAEIQAAKVDEEQLLRQIHNPNQRSGKIGELANKIAAFLQEEHAYLTDAGVDVGNVGAGYWPRELDMARVGASREKFLEQAAKAYRLIGMSQKDARAAAEEWYLNALFGAPSLPGARPRGTPVPSFIQGRKLPKEADNLLREFYVSDVSAVLSSYVSRAARRAEIARRFGDGWSHWADFEDRIKAEGAGGALPTLRTFVAHAAGVQPQNVSHSVAVAASALRTWTTLALLEKATLASIVEPIAIIMRAGGGLRETSEALVGTVRQLFRKYSKNQQLIRDLASDIGIIAGENANALMAARFAAGDPLGRAQSLVLAAYFRRTGLEQWTNATRVAAMRTGQVFLRRLALDLDKGRNGADFFLAELGILKAEQKAFAAYVRKFGDTLPQTVAEIGTGRMAELYKAALFRFADQSIMRPNALTRPRWASHPLGAVAFQLQAFNYAFTRQVLGRTARLLKAGVSGELPRGVALRTVGAQLAMMYPAIMLASYGVGAVRDALFTDPAIKEAMTPSARIERAASQGGLFGALDPFVQMIGGSRYGKSPLDVVAGPVIGRMSEAIAALLAVAFRNSPQTNASERKAWMTIYDMVVEPAANTMLTAVAPSPASAALTVGAIPALRKVWTDALAGEAAPKALPPIEGAIAMTLRAIAGGEPPKAGDVRPRVASGVRPERPSAQ